MAVGELRGRQARPTPSSGSPARPTTATPSRGSTPSAASGTSGCCLPNTTFRDGVLENFAASPTYPDHVYLTYEDWDGTQFDVKFSQSIDGGRRGRARGRERRGRLREDGPVPAVRRGGAGRRGRGRVLRPACRMPARQERPPGGSGPRELLHRRLGAALRGHGRRRGRGGRQRARLDVHVGPGAAGPDVDGLDQMACANHSNPCATARSSGTTSGSPSRTANVYTFAVSTHYPSAVRGRRREGLLPAAGARHDRAR